MPEIEIEKSGFMGGLSAMKNTYALYVSTDLTWWLTDDPDNVADKVVVYGKTFVRLTPAVIAWLKQQVLRAERACNTGKISLEKFRAIIKAFCPIYEFAIAQGMVANPVEECDRAVTSSDRAVKPSDRAVKPSDRAVTSSSATTVNAA
jgi:hypothetical protein